LIEEKSIVMEKVELKVRPEFPVFLKQQRELRGWSGAELARRAGIKSHNLPTSYEDIEYLAQHQPSAEQLIKLADGLNSDPNYPFVTPVKLLYLAGYNVEDPDEHPIVWPHDVQRLARFVMRITSTEQRQKFISFVISAVDTLLGHKDEEA
jgi:transcriptional regulator with XRE-family HTH domain